jgi:hypothetical protein
MVVPIDAPRGSLAARDDMRWGEMSWSAAMQSVGGLLVLTGRERHSQNRG